MSTTTKMPRHILKTIAGATAALALGTPAHSQPLSSANVPDARQGSGDTFSVTLTNGKTQTLPSDRVTQEAFTKASSEGQSGLPRPEMARVVTGDVETCAKGGATVMLQSPEIESMQCNSPDGQTVMLERGQGGQIRRTNFGPGF